jgi:hypothetical protein
MSSPAKGAKYVAALAVGVVSAGAFAGVSHDGRGGDLPVYPEPIVEVPPPVEATQSATSVESTQPATRATPDPVPTRAAVRSRGS